MILPVGGGALPVGAVKVIVPISAAPGTVTVRISVSIVIAPVVILSIVPVISIVSVPVGIPVILPPTGTGRRAPAGAAAAAVGPVVIVVIVVTHSISPPDKHSETEKSSGSLQFYIVQDIISYLPAPENTQFVKILQNIVTYFGRNPDLRFTLAGNYDTIITNHQSFPSRWGKAIYGETRGLYDVTFQLVDPAGETILLVSSPVPAQEQTEITQRLLSLPELQAKAVAFLAPPTGQGVLRLETAEGQFNGNALMQAAMAFAVSRGIRREKKFSLEVPGQQTPLTVHANPLTARPQRASPSTSPGEATPSWARRFPWSSSPAWPTPILKGAALPPEADLLPALRELARRLGTPAAGVIAWDFRADTICAARALSGGDGLYLPQICASSAAAVAAWQGLHSRDGHHKLTLQQPGGALQTTTSVQGGRLRRLTVSGPVQLGPVYQLAF